MTRRSITRTLAAGAAVLSLALAGCGSDDEPEGRSSASPSSTASESESAAAAGKTDVGDVIANAMEKGKTAHVAMVMADEVEAEGDIDLREGAPAMDLTMTLMRREVHMIMVDGVMYLRMPDAGDKFMKIDPAQAGAMEGLDPSKMLDELRSMKGGEDLGGGHYRYRRDGSTADVYVGEGGLIERVVVDTGAGKVEMTYSDWGKDVDIQAPAAGETMEMPDGQFAG